MRAMKDRRYRRTVTSARPKWKTLARRQVGNIILLIGVVASGIYLFYEFPPALQEKSGISTHVMMGDYTDPFIVSGGALVSSRGPGVNGEVNTHLEYVVTVPADSTSSPRVRLAARVIHDTGAVMVCESRKPVTLSSERVTQALKCDRTVELDKLDEWSVSELTPRFL